MSVGDHMSKVELYADQIVSRRWNNGDVAASYQDGFAARLDRCIVVRCVGFDLVCAANKE